MGCFDTVRIPCPHCHQRLEYQSKAYRCNLETYELEEAPAPILGDLAFHPRFTCPNCSKTFKVCVHAMAATAPCATSFDEDEDT